MIDILEEIRQTLLEVNPPSKTQYYIDILLNAIAENKPHRDYDYVVKLAEQYNQIMTGEGQDKWVLSYRPRESDDEKRQRLDITISRTDQQSNRFVILTDKISRADNVVDNIYYESDTQDATKIENVVSEFFGGLSLNDYIHQVVQHYNFYDPNAWLMINFERDGDTVTPYPVEFPSSEVYQYKQGINSTEWFIALQKITVNDNIVNKFTLLAGDIGVTAIEQGEKEINALSYKVNDKYYSVEAVVTDSKVTPAFKVGYITDPKTSRRTFVSILHPALKAFKRLINYGSEYDLSMGLHGFLKMYQYANVCEYEIETEGHISRCNEGYLNIDGSKVECGNCKGTGLILHKSPQDVILIKYPDGKDEHIPLQEMIHYVHIPMDIVNLQKDNIDRAIEDIQISVLNTQLVDRAEVMRNVTATEKIIDLDNVNSILYKHGKNFARLKKDVVHQSAIYMGVNDGLIVNHEFPKDFQLETVAQLIGMRETALKAAAPYAIVENIDTKILVKQSQGDQVNVQWVRAWEKFKPWKELAVNEKLNVLAELPVTDKKRVLYIYFDEVKNYVESKYSDFYLIKNTAAQQEIIDAAVEYMMEKYDIKEPEQTQTDIFA